MNTIDDGRMASIHALALGLVTGLGIAIPLGAIGVMLVMEGAERGLRSALGAAAGVATVDAAHAAAATVFGAAIAPNLNRLGPYPGIVGGSLLLLVAAHSVIDARSTSRRAQPTSKRAESTRDGRYLVFAGLTAMNPTTLIYFTSVAVPAIAAPTRGRLNGWDATLFVIGVGAGSVLWQAVLAITGAAAGTRITGRGRQVTIVVGNAVVGALGLSLIAASLR